MLPCATQDFRNAVAEFDYVFSREANPAGAIRSANCRWKPISFHARLRRQKCSIPTTAAVCLWRRDRSAAAHRQPDMILEYLGIADR
jgi:hypothetical protein